MSGNAGRLDRYGDPIEDDAEEAPVEHPCTDGWLADDPTGRRRPCLVCKPHLVPKGPDQPGFRVVRSRLKQNS